MLCRSILLLLLLLLLLVLAADGAEARRRHSGDRRPNFVLLFVDDLGYGDLGFNGHPTTQTPNLDRLAFSGKTLTSWYSGCSVCTGSRSALMTGRQFPRTGLPGVLGPTGNIGLPLNETTIATHVSKRNNAAILLCQSATNFSNFLWVLRAFTNNSVIVPSYLAFLYFFLPFCHFTAQLTVATSRLRNSNCWKMALGSATPVLARKQRF